MSFFVYDHIPAVIFDARGAKVAFGDFDPAASFDGVEIQLGDIDLPGPVEEALVKVKDPGQDTQDSGHVVGVVPLEPRKRTS